MATVPDKANNGTPIDKKFATPNRGNAGTPVAAVTPLYTNEIVLDTTNNQLWRATGPTNADWMPYTRAVC